MNKILFKPTLQAEIGKLSTSQVNVQRDLTNALNETVAVRQQVSEKQTELDKKEERIEDSNKTITQVSVAHLTLSPLEMT